MIPNVADPSYLGNPRLHREKMAAILVSKDYNRFLKRFIISFLDKKSTSYLRFFFEITLNRILLDAYLFGADSAIRDFGFNTLEQVSNQRSFDLTNEQAIKHLNLRAMKSSDSIHSTTLGIFRRQKDSDDILKYAKKSRVWRPLLIARREFFFGFSLARFHMFQKSGISRALWFNGNLDRKPAHFKNQTEGFISLGDNFSSGVFSPGLEDTDSFGCRCILLPDILNLDEDGIWTGS